MTAQLLAMAGLHGLGWPELLALFSHFFVLSLLAVGGVITMAPGMHSYLINEHHWMTDGQFTASIALAQAAPGPNVLFVAVLGWNVAGVAGMVATITGMLIPSSLIAWAVGRWGHGRSDHPVMRVFTAGLTPLTIGLLSATSWVLTDPIRTSPLTYVLVGVTLWVMLRTRLSPMWLVALGAVAGALGWV